MNLTRHFTGLATVCALLILAGCGPQYMESKVPFITSPADISYPLPEGEYDTYVKSDTKPDSGAPWVLSQTHLKLSRGSEGYDVRPSPLSKTFVKAGVAPQAEGSELGSLIANVWWRPIDSDFTGAMGFATRSLNNNFYVMQMPSTIDPNRWAKNAKRQWFILVLNHKTDSEEVSFLSEAGAKASSAILGSKQECDSQGKCKQVPVVQEFTETLDVNLSIVKKAVTDYSGDVMPALKLVRSR